MNRKKKASRQKIISTTVFLLIGVICGFFGGNYIGSMLQDKPAPEQLMELTLFAFGLMVALFLQIIIHEAGHLICGTLTGYQFSSFRIGSLMWIKEHEKITFKKLSLAGMAGQCLMDPPSMINGKFPFVLYNLGGVLLNITSGLVFLGSAAICQSIAYLPVLLLFISVIGFAYALMNGIPMRLGAVDNDGYNAMSLGKNSEAARSFWLQLNMNGQIARGMRLKDMPSRWFYVPTDDGMKNSMTAVMGVVYCNLLMDTHSFEEAYKLMDQWLEMDSAIVGLHRNLLSCDRIYCELIGEKRKERLDAMLDKELKRFMKSMRHFPSVLRTAYAYAVLVEEDADKAAKIKAAFEKEIRTYPYHGDTESERELIEIADHHARQTKLG